VGEHGKSEETDWRSVGAGTVEFIMDAETGEYFFMEMYVPSLSGQARL